MCIHVCVYMYTHIHTNGMKLGELGSCLNLVRVLCYPILFRDAHVLNMFRISYCENIKSSSKNRKPVQE